MPIDSPTSVISMHSRPARRSRSSASRPVTRTRCSASTRGDLVLVLRRPPRTPLSPTAHDMAREFRVLARVPRPAPTVPVPRPVALCTDPDVIGAPFYLMDAVDGVVVRDRVPRAARRRSGRAARVRVRARSTRSPASTRFDWERRRPRRLRPARRVSRTPGAALARSARAVQDARRCPRSTKPGRWLAAHTPTMQPPGGDPRRLQARQRDVRAAPPGRAGCGRRLGAVDDRRSARRSRLGASVCGSSRASARRSPARRRSPPGADVPTRAELDRSRTPTQTGRDLVEPRVLLRARAVQARVRDGRLVRALHGGHERRRVLRRAREGVPALAAPRARVRARHESSR